MASTVWKGYIAFGLISIPVRLFAAARDERVSFNQIHRECNTRIRQQVFCPTCDRNVERSEIAKGYATAKDQYVLIDDEDLKKIAPPSSETMEIVQFVKLSEIDPLYFDASYYTVPEEPGKKAYQLLLSVMRKLDLVALAKVTMHQREYAIALRAYDHGITMHTMYYANEVRKVSEYDGLSEDANLKPQEVDMAEKLINALAKPFDPEMFQDDYQHRVLELIEAKGEGKMVKASSTKRLAPVIDLMKALESSLAEVRDSPAKKKAPTKTTKSREVASIESGRKAAR
jgi:DNA end-binding protein Ku